MPIVHIDYADYGRDTRNVLAVRIDGIIYSAAELCHIEVDASTHTELFDELDLRILVNEYALAWKGLSQLAEQLYGKDEEENGDE